MTKYFTEEERTAAKKAAKRRYYERNREVFLARHHEAYLVDPAPRKAAARKRRETKAEECRAADRKYREANAEKQKAYAREYYLANKEHLKTAAKQNRESNPDRCKASYAAWWANNLERGRASGRLRCLNYRAKLKAVGGRLSIGLADLLLSEQGGKCCSCDTSLHQAGYHLDHYMPVALGGANEDWNIQLLCPPCNLKKSDAHPSEYFNRRFACLVASSKFPLMTVNSNDI